ncbi:MAG: hypothetical protein IH985_02300 [Planctomycetes bacterium]|nr:hypothetical protein [Planctomycetota bacterium]
MSNDSGVRVWNGPGSAAPLTESRWGSREYDGPGGGMTRLGGEVMGVVCE